jgi:hypothetical protein
VAAASAAAVTGVSRPASPDIAVLASAVLTSYRRLSAPVASSPARTAWVATASVPPVPPAGPAPAILAADSSTLGSCTIWASIT